MYLQIDSGTILMPVHGSCAQNQQRLGSPCKEFCMGLSTDQHSWNINGRCVSLTAEKNSHASIVLGKIGACNRSTGCSETKKRQAQLFIQLRWW